MNLMEELDVISYLVFKKDGDDGSEILIGGHSEALIIHATKVQKITDGETHIDVVIHLFDWKSF